MKVSVRSEGESFLPRVFKSGCVPPSTYGDPESKTSRHVPKHETCSRLGDIVRELERRQPGRCRGPRGVRLGTYSDTITPAA